MLDHYVHYSQRRMLQMAMAIGYWWLATQPEATTSWQPVGNQLATSWRLVARAKVRALQKKKKKLSTYLRYFT